MCLHSRGGPIGSRATPVSPILSEAPPSGRASADPPVPPQDRRVPPSELGARPSPLCPAGRSLRARRSRRGLLPTRGRGFEGEEGPQASVRSGRPRSGCSVPRVRRGGPAAPLAFPTTQQTGPVRGRSGLARWAGVLRLAPLEPNQHAPTMIRVLATPD
ncbi:hypothetical protein NDU88_004831 [Pleurodeles waltl]|uniref:Uncharacterized protein n=1 Tax=Pleurodeles waltl TaxID=8319 RepID=A0AAV7PHV4_PLEWA|nr:hypothetical protein NDU88_004831 [Pleurodeles waltl]